MNRDSQAAALVRRIQQAVAAVPAGRTCSYGVIAQRAGAPGRARLVGRVLREAPAELGLPWHRIVRADGRLAFPAGSPAHAEQRRRLRAEGVQMQGERVSPDSRWPTPDLDALLWRPGP